MKQLKSLLALVSASLALSSPIDARLFHGGTPVSAPSQSISSISGCAGSTFPAGVANGVICTATVNMSPSSPSFTGSLSVVGTNSGGFHFVGSVLQQSGSGTSVGTYTDFTIRATQAGVSNSPFNQAGNVTGTTPSQTISSISGCAGGTFTAGVANGAVCTATVMMSPSSPGFTGSLSVVGTNSGGFHFVGSALEQSSGGTSAGTYTDFTIRATQAGISNSPFDQAGNVTGSGAGLITSYTVKNQGGTTIPSGTTVIMGQAFRRGDVPTGNCVRVANSSGSTLTHQWDEISTRHYNSDDGSWIHGVWSAQTDASIAAGATYTFNFYTTGTTCPSNTQKQSLAALAGAHDLKLRLTDVRNQNYTVRGSGNWTFSVNAAASNTGRDAPRKCATGPARDCWIVMGAPVDDSTGSKDPMLYVKCYLDLTTSASDHTSLGPVRHVCHVLNPWENVAAGSAGNSGSPGPVGLTNDPQAVTYRPTLLDGSTTLLDWSWLDQSVTSSSNPIDLSGGCNGCISIPGQGGYTNNQWFFGQPVLFTTSGTPPAGLTNNQLYYVFDYGNWSSHTPTVVKLDLHPWMPGTVDNITSQGSGTFNFSYRTYQPKWGSWLTVDQNAADNWTNGAARATVLLYPAFTTAEQQYWQKTGTVLPLQLSQTVTPPGFDYSNHTAPYYGPFSRAHIIGGAQGGPRADIGGLNEWAAEAFLLQTKGAWDLTRIYTAASAGDPGATILNESTGYVPVLNNGPLSGLSGGGGNYTTLGAPQNNTAWTCDANLGMATPLENVPQSGDRYCLGAWNTISTGNDHQAQFGGLNYLFFGNAHYLDAMYMMADRALAIHQGGNGEGARDFDLGGATHYWGLHFGCCQNRGAAWAHRDISWAAAMGADAHPERTYYHDVLVENHNYWTAFRLWKDGGVTNGYSNALKIPGGGGFDDTFIDAYWAQALYAPYAMMRDPMAVDWYPSQLLPLYIALCGGDLSEGGANVNTISSYYCASFGYNSALHNVDALINNSAGGPNWGQYYNHTDAADYGQMATDYNFSASDSRVRANSLQYDFTAGDTIHIMSGGSPNTPVQLDPSTWYTITNVDYGCSSCGAGSFEIINPATGTPFTSWTARPRDGGGPFSTGDTWMKIRPLRVEPDSKGVQSYGYAKYAIDIIYALYIHGFHGIDHAVTRIDARFAGFLASNGFGYFSPSETIFTWDKSVVVP